MLGKSITCIRLLFLFILHFLEHGVFVFVLFCLIFFVCIFFVVENFKKTKIILVHCFSFRLLSYAHR